MGGGVNFPLLRLFNHRLPTPGSKFPRANLLEHYKLPYLDIFPYLLARNKVQLQKKGGGNYCILPLTFNQYTLVYRIISLVLRAIF